MLLAKADRIGEMSREKKYEAGQPVQCDEIPFND